MPKKKEVPQNETVMPQNETVTPEVTPQIIVEGKVISITDTWVDGVSVNHVLLELPKGEYKLDTKYELKEIV